eukprot:8304442-Pyramimonas_sp.AAC.1
MSACEQWISRPSRACWSRCFSSVMLWLLMSGRSAIAMCVSLLARVHPLAAGAGMHSYPKRRKMYASSV